MAHYELQDWEADDIIGTLAKQAEAAGWETTVITGDRDLTQLATDHVTVQVTKKGVKELEAFTPEYLKEKVGVTPKQFIDMKG
jgi:DNA polymerase-1